MAGVHGAHGQEGLGVLRVLRMLSGSVNPPRLRPGQQMCMEAMRGSFCGPCCMLLLRAQTGELPVLVLGVCVCADTVAFARGDGQTCNCG